MADIEKTIKELKDGLDFKIYDSICVLLEVTTVSNALELLKEQQPKEPMQLKYSETREEYWFYESICPKCGNRWISNGTDHFCPACGQPVFEPCEEEQKDGEQE